MREEKEIKLKREVRFENSLALFCKVKYLYVF